MKKLIGCLLLLVTLGLERGEAQYARLEVVPYQYFSDSSPYGANSTYFWSYELTAVSIKFYSDAACTVPYTLTSNVAFTFTLEDIADAYVGTGSSYNSRSNTFYAEAGTSEMLIDDVFQIVADERIYANNDPGNYSLYIQYKSYFHLDYVANGFTILPNKYPSSYVFPPYY